MDISKLTFTKETKEKMGGSLNHFQRGELRWNRLKELDGSGDLGKATNRKDIMRLMKFPDGYKAGYSWVSNLVARGHLKEILTGFGKDNKPMYEYHLVGKPNYDSTPKGKKAKKPTPSKEVSVVETCGNANMVIRYKELTIELNNIDKSIIEEIIEKLADRQ